MKHWNQKYYDYYDDEEDGIDDDIDDDIDIQEENDDIQENFKLKKYKDFK